jgi:hypothetical protein
MRIAAYVIREKLLTRVCHVADNSLTELHGGGRAPVAFKLKPAMVTSHSRPAEQGLPVRFQGEQGHIVVPEATEDEIHDAAGELIEIEDVRNLGTYPAYER